MVFEQSSTAKCAASPDDHKERSCCFSGKSFVPFKEVLLEGDDNRTSRVN